MTIRPGKASDYNDVNSGAIVGYIKDYLGDINACVNKAGASLKDKDRAQLKAIAAELETVKKRLEWLVEGRY